MDVYYGQVDKAIMVKTMEEGLLSCPTIFARAGLLGLKKASSEPQAKRRPLDHSLEENEFNNQQQSDLFTPSDETMWSVVQTHTHTHALFLDETIWSEINLKFEVERDMYGIELNFLRLERDVLGDPKIGP